MIILLMLLLIIIIFANVVVASTHCRHILMMMTRIKSIGNGGPAIVNYIIVCECRPYRWRWWRWRWCRQDSIAIKLWWTTNHHPLTPTNTTHHCSCSGASPIAIEHRCACDDNHCPPHHYFLSISVLHSLKHSQPNTKNFYGHPQNPEIEIQLKHAED